ncbi:hypothetical protein GX51_02634 [Blastomyces parvus]|uniref:Uncharacterized protein n=1 Tax=Blastomyces parvus TaxID=2060905 RepID=A0A2B7XB88_9EURO|nr:hypothetical protein GX51_02634 [Blastomyces parvus]
MAEKTPMKMKWDHAAEAKLLKQIIKNAKLGKKDHEELAEFMGCTPRAIKEHIASMQKAATPKDASGGSGSPSPRKNGKSTPEQRTPASRKGSNKRKSASEDDENDLVDDSPLKKVKAEDSDGTKINYIYKNGGTKYEI